jgi:hypothetical protein
LKLEKIVVDIKRIAWQDYKNQGGFEDNQKVMAKTRKIKSSGKAPCCRVYRHKALKVGK